MNNKLQKNNYLIVPNFINKFRAQELGQEFKIFCENENISGDSQAPNSKAFYNYISFIELLCEKTSEVSHILEEIVLPTYCYSRVYSNNDILERHSDRHECEISLTLHLDSDKSWPIYIVDPKGNEKKVTLNPGDAMMYLGTIAEHWRYEYCGNYYTQVFLHYVRSRGPYGETYFDRKNINTSNQKNNSFSFNDVEEVQEPKKCNDKILVSKKDFDYTNLGIDPSNIRGVLMPSPSNTLEQYIHVFNNVIPDHVCDEIINEFSNSSEWLDAEIGDVNTPVNKNVRNCESILLSNVEVIEKNVELRKRLDEKLFESVQTAMKLYADIHTDFNIEIDTGYQLLKYETGGFYIQHVDSFRQQQRSVSCAMILNDDYDGGEFAFFDRQVMIKSRKGSVIMFPSNFMYPHEIMPVTKGTRYSIITWLV